MAPKALVLAGLAFAAAGAWMLATSPDASTAHRVWRPGEAVALTQDTANQTWSWSFRLPNDGGAPMRVELGFTFNVTEVRSEGGAEFQVMTWLDVDGAHAQGYRRGGTGFGDGTYTRYRLPHEWTIPPGGESFVEATAHNVPLAGQAGDWRVDYDPVRFDVATTTRTVDPAAAWTGAGLATAGLAALATAKARWRPAS